MMLREKLVSYYRSWQLTLHWKGSQSHMTSGLRKKLSEWLKQKFAHCFEFPAISLNIFSGSNYKFQCFLYRTFWRKNKLVYVSILRPSGYTDKKGNCYLLCKILRILLLYDRPLIFAGLINWSDVFVTKIWTPATVLILYYGLLIILITLILSLNSALSLT